MARGEGIKKLSDLFDKYKNTLKAPQGSIVNVFCEVVEDVLDISLSKNQVTFNTFTKIITLNTPGVVKSEIKLNKKEILSHLKGRLGVSSAPKDIV